MDTAPPRARFSAKPFGSLGLVRAAALAAFLYFFLRVFLPGLTEMTYGFPGYYTGARLIFEGRFGAKAYDYPWYRDQTLVYTHGLIGETMGNAPPTTELLVLPIAWLNVESARIVWQIANLIFLAIALWLILHTTATADATYHALFLLGVFLYTPLWENFRVGQAYALLLALYAVCWWSIARGHAVQGGIALGIAGALKLSGAPLWLILLARKNWRGLGAAIAAGILIVILSVSVSGIDGWHEFIFGMPERLASSPSNGTLAYQTTPSFFQHLFVFQTNWNPQPLLNAPLLASALTLVIALSALGLTYWYARDAKLDVAFAAGVTLAVILFPLAEEYHYTLLLIPLYVMGSRLYPARRAGDILWFVVILLLLAFPWDYKATALNNGWVALLAYPRLYGGWLLWLWLFKQMYHPLAARVGLPLGATP